MYSNRSNFTDTGSEQRPITLNVIRKQNNVLEIELHVQPEDIALHLINNYSVLLQPVDRLDDESRECGVLFNRDTRTFKLDCQLPPGRIWTCKLLKHDGLNSTEVLGNLKLS